MEHLVFIEGVCSGSTAELMYRAASFRAVQRGKKRQPEACVGLLKTPVSDIGEDRCEGEM